MRVLRLSLAMMCVLPAVQIRAEKPEVVAVFPAGGRRGTDVDVRVEAIGIPSRANVEALGPGLDPGKEIRRTARVWFDGPALVMPESLLPEQYPQDFAARFTISPDARSGTRGLRFWNSEGASGSIPFVIGELPEVIETEVEDGPTAQKVVLPVTANGRMFPREDVDAWSFHLSKGEILTAIAEAGRFGSPLVPCIEAFDPAGHRIAEGARTEFDGTRLSFNAPRDGEYSVRVHDVGFGGGQRLVYRLTLTAGPTVDWIYPLGGRKGDSISVVAGGSGLSLQGKTILGAQGTPGEGPTTTTAALSGGHSVSLEVDDLDEFHESEPKADLALANKMSVPGVANGRVDLPGDVDRWEMRLSKGTTYLIDLRAARLGSALDGNLSLQDGRGHVLCKADSSLMTGSDPSLAFRPDADGLYTVSVRDRYRTRGGPGYGYRLRVSPLAGPAFRLSLLEDAMTIMRGGKATLEVIADHLETVEGPVDISVEGLPPGVTHEKLRLTPESPQGKLSFEADPLAPIQSTRVAIVGTAKSATGTAPVIARRRSSLLPEIDTVRLAVGFPNPFTLSGPIDFSRSPRGTRRHHSYKVEAKGLVGSVEVRLADRQIRHLQGIKAETLLLPSDALDFDFVLNFSPDMELGRVSRAVISTAGVVRDLDGTLHDVSHTWDDQQYTFTNIILPGLIEVACEKDTVVLEPGLATEVSIKVVRGKGVNGPIRVSLHPAEQPNGIVADPLVIQDGQQGGLLRLVRSPETTGATVSRITLRAEATLDGEPIRAETSLGIIDSSRLDVSTAERSGSDRHAK